MFEICIKLGLLDIELLILLVYRMVTHKTNNAKSL